MGNKLRGKILVILLAALLIAYAPVLSQQPQNKIVSPRTGTPIFVEPQGNFTVTFMSQDKDATVEISNDTWEYKPKILSSEIQGVNTVLTVKLGPEVSEGLYTITVVSKGSRYSEPNSLVVRHFEDELTIMVIGDMHYNPRPDRWTTVEVMRTVVDEANALRPDLVIFIGDQVDFSRNETHWELFMQEVYRRRVPAILVMGNNDFVNNKPDLFIKYQGEPVAYRRVGPVNLIILNSGNGIIREDQRNWLKETLQSISPGYTIVCFHHPRKSLEEADKAGTDELFNIMNQYNVNLVLCGHIHRNSVDKYGNIYQVVTVSPSLPAEGFKGQNIIRIKDRTANYDELYDVGTFANFKIPNNGEFPASIAAFKNPTGEKLTLKPIVMLKDHGENPTIIGAEKTLEYSKDGVRYIHLSLTLNPGETGEIKCYYQEDKEKPSIEDVSYTPETPKPGEKVKVTAKITDSGWGLKNTTLLYAYNGGEWKEVPFKGSMEIKIPEDAQTLIFKFKAEDYAGNTVESQVYTVTVSKGFASITLVVAAIVIVAIAALAILMVKKKS